MFARASRAARWITAAPRGGFAPLFAVTAIGLLLALLALTVWRDPYWVFRNDPPWLHETGGANRLVDLDMRRVKPLQLMARPHGTVLVGSSVVYRGLDPEDVRPAAKPGIYNLGISALMAAELPVVADLVVVAGSVERVVIGLDYFMFSGFHAPSPIRPDLATPQGRAFALAGAALSTRALEHLSAKMLARAEPGAWHYSGFKTTPNFPPDLTRRIDAAQDHAAMDYRPRHLPDLALALDRLTGHDVIVFLSPVSGAQIKGLRAAGRGPEFDRWRADVAALAAGRGLRFADLALDHPFDDFDPEQGSSRYWIDNLHFKPVVGRWVLEKLGLAR